MGANDTDILHTLVTCSECIFGTKQYHLYYMTSNKETCIHSVYEDHMTERNQVDTTTFVRNRKNH